MVPVPKDGINAGFHPGDSWVTPGIGFNFLDYVSPDGFIDISYFMPLDHDYIFDTTTHKMTSIYKLLAAIRPHSKVRLNDIVAEALLDKDPNVFADKELFYDD